jgi:hypothetical protein
MKYLVVTVLLTGVLTCVAHAESPACKRQVGEKGAQADCKKSPRVRRGPAPGSGLSADHKEKLERAHTRHLLENIESDLRRQRLGK